MAQAVTTVVTSLTALGALVFTGLSLDATRDQIAVSRHQNELAQQEKYIERYATAVAQLDRAGPENLKTRLGGVHSLERLAEDSPRDRPTIVNVLASFVTSTVQRGTSTTRDDCPPRVAPDIQAAFTMWIKYGNELDDRPPGHDMDLTNACLNEVVLDGAFLMWADLTGARLRWASLRDTELTGTKIRLSLHEGANLSGAVTGHPV